MFLALKNKKKIVCYQWLQLKQIYSMILALTLSIPNTTAYLSALYTVPEYRGKGLASSLIALILKYLQEHRYQKAFVLIEPDNTASKRAYKKFGFKEYQTILHRRFLFLKYYGVKEYDTNRKKVFWHITKTDQELWKTFSALGSD